MHECKLGTLQDTEDTEVSVFVGFVCEIVYSL